MEVLDNLSLDNLTVDNLQQAMKRLESRFAARAVHRTIDSQRTTQAEGNDDDPSPESHNDVSFYLFNRRNSEHHSEQRPYLQDISLSLPGTRRVRYRGQELRGDDHAVWLQLLQRCQQISADVAAPGYIEFTPHSMLKALGWNHTHHDRARLRDCLERMQATALCILGPNAEQGMSMSLIAKYGWVQATARSAGRWRVWVEPELIDLFNGHGTAKMAKSKLGVMAQWLRQLYSAYAEPYPRRIETLQQQCPWHFSPKVFRSELENALDELQKTDFLQSYQIDGRDLVRISKGHLKRH